MEGGKDNLPSVERAFLVDCRRHGLQKVFLGPSQGVWPEEAAEILRELGDLKEGEEYRTAECPVCHTTLRARPAEQDDLRKVAVQSNA